VSLGSLAQKGTKDLEVTGAQPGESLPDLVAHPEFVGKHQVLPGERAETAPAEPG
jgi:hypothetical protein